MNYTDMLGRSVILSSVPKRVISLVPSQTELLYDLGLNDAVIGITKFCVHPDVWFQTKQRVGGTKNVNIALVKSLKPDFIIANKEENVQELIELLSAICPVWVSDINKLEDAYFMIEQLGYIFNVRNVAQQMTKKLREDFNKVRNIFENKKVAYFIWKDPWMSVGKDTFIHSILSHIGLDNVFRDLNRYPEIQLNDLSDAKVDYVFLSTEPYPFKENHVEGIRQTLANNAIVIIVDGELFSWYGSRLLHAPKYFSSLFVKLKNG